MVVLVMAHSWVLGRRVLSQGLPITADSERRLGGRNDTCQQRRRPKDGGVKRKKYSVKCAQRVAESFVVLRGRAREAGKINASFIYFQIRP
jgi:hypothetical protein